MKNEELIVNSRKCAFATFSNTIHHSLFTINYSLRHESHISAPLGSPRLPYLRELSAKLTEGFIRYLANASATVNYNILFYLTLKNLIDIKI